LIVSEDLSLNGRLFVSGNAVFNGTVTGITRTMVGLSNVDNTSDINKPISTATQTYVDSSLNTLKTYVDNSMSTFRTNYIDASLNLKAATNYVDSSLNLKASTNYVDNSLNSKAAKSYVDSSLNLKAAIVSPTFTGTVTIPTAIIGNLTISDKLTASGGLISVSDISVNTRILVRTDVSLGGRLFVEGDSNINGNLTIKGTLNVQEIRNENITNTTTTTITNYELLTAEDISLNGRLFSSGDVSLNSRLFVNQDASFNNRVLVGSDLSLGGRLFINGTQFTGTGGSAFITDISTTSRLFVNDDASFNNRVLVGSDFSLGGRLFLQGIQLYKTTTTTTTNISPNSNIIDITNNNGNTWTSNSIIWKAESSTSYYDNYFGINKLPQNSFRPDIVNNDTINTGPWTSLPLYSYSLSPFNYGIYGITNTQLNQSIDVLGYNIVVNSLSGEWLQIGSTNKPSIMNSFQLTSDPSGASPGHFVICGSNTENANVWNPIIDVSYLYNPYQLTVTIQNNNSNDFNGNANLSSNTIINTTSTTNGLTNFIIPSEIVNNQIDSSNNYICSTFSNNTTEYSYYRLIVLSLLGNNYGGYAKTPIASVIIPQWKPNFTISNYNDNLNVGSDVSLGGRLNVGSDVSLGGRLFASNVNSNNVNSNNVYSNNVNSNNISIKKVEFKFDNFSPNMPNLNSSYWIKFGIIWSTISSSFSPGYLPINAFNNDSFLSWRSQLNTYEISSGSYNGSTTTNYIENGNNVSILGEWLQINASKVMSVNSYTFARSRIGSTASANLPKEFLILGSIDNDTWYPIQSSSLDSMPTNNMEYSIPAYIDAKKTGNYTYGISTITTTAYNSNNEYNFFRLVIRELFADNSGYAEIGEFSINFASSSIEINSAASLYMDNTLLNTLVVQGDLNVSGVLKASNFSAGSDYRIKSDIEQLNGNYTVQNLIPRKYYNKQLNKYDLGLIAHELQEQYPILVEGRKDGENYQSVNYIGLIPILINDIQKQQQQITNLANKLELAEETILEQSQTILEQSQTILDLQSQIDIINNKISSFIN